MSIQISAPLRDGLEYTSLCLQSWQITLLLCQLRYTAHICHNRHKVHLILIYAVLFRGNFEVQYKTKISKSVEFGNQLIWASSGCVCACGGGAFMLRNICDNLTILTVADNPNVLRGVWGLQRRGGGGGGGFPRTSGFPPPPPDIANSGVIRSSSRGRGGGRDFTTISLSLHNLPLPVHM